MQTDLDYRVVIDTTPTLIFSALPDGQVDYVNRAFLEFLGTSFDHLDGSSWTKFIHPDDLEEHARRWRESTALGQPAISEARYLMPNGEYRWLLVYTRPLRDDRGEVIRWFGATTDIEHAKRVEEVLRTAEKDVRTILETIPAIVWTARPDGSLDFISQTWTERMGGERRGWLWTDVVHDDDIERVVHEWRGALDTGRPFDHEFRLRERDGNYRWYLVRAVPRRSDGGAILRQYGTITDIDARKRAEDDLRALKDQLYQENISAIRQVANAQRRSSIAREDRLWARGGATTLSRLLDCGLR